MFLPALTVNGKVKHFFFCIHSKHELYIYSLVMTLQRMLLKISKTKFGRQVRTATVKNA